MSAVEANFDGLVGPTHNYAGLALGNLASSQNQGGVSNPREAALQGLAKMRRMLELGHVQGVLPPQDRPYLPVLRQLGFSGSDAEVIAAAARHGALLATCSSASCMWTANAATVSPSADCADGRVHFTPANLVTNFHRSIETEQTAATLKAVFADPDCFVHHAPLPAVAAFGDEGAANHTRLCDSYGVAGIEMFVYGDEQAGGSLRYPARQTRLSVEALIRKHGLGADAVVAVQQHPAAINAGVFHNDVIAVGDRRTLLCHEQAFVDSAAVHARLQALMPSLAIIEVSAADVTLQEAVSSYLFNSQLLDDGAGGRRLLVPSECRSTPSVWTQLQRWLDDGTLTDLQVMTLNQSMRNGGGPACLRLRVVLTPQEQAAVAPGCLLDAAAIDRLEDWVRRHYRDRLAPADLADPALLLESRAALDELTGLLGLGALYEFQR